MTCIDCKHYLPSDETFYNKPVGYCAHPRNGHTVKGLSAACARFEKSPSIARTATRKTQ